MSRLIIKANYLHLHMCLMVKVRRTNNEIIIFKYERKVREKKDYINKEAD